MARSSSAEVLLFPTNRKRAYRNPPIPWAKLPENVVALRRTVPAGDRVQPRKAEFPELAQSPELALVMAMFAALPAKARKQVGRELSLLAWRNGGSGVEAPNAAYDLVVRMNALLDKERGR